MQLKVEAMSCRYIAATFNFNAVEKQIFDRQCGLSFRTLFYGLKCGTTF